jgi:hypothetical protein
MTDPSVYECGIKYGQCKRMNQVCDRAFFGIGEDQKEGIKGCIKCYDEYQKCNKIPIAELYTKPKPKKCALNYVDIVNLILLGMILLLSLSIICILCMKKKYSR